MKKTTTYPDGRIETIEGTAEEFAALERARAEPAAVTVKFVPASEPVFVPVLQPIPTWPRPVPDLTPDIWWGRPIWRIPLTGENGTVICNTDGEVTIQ